MFDLNLLDTNRKSSLRDQGRARRLAHFFLYIIVVLVIEALAVLEFRIRINERYQSAVQELESTNISTTNGKALPVHETTKKINDYLHILDPIAHDAAADRLLDDIRNNLPRGFRLTAVTFSSPTNELELIGTAAIRNDIPAFEKNLGAIPYLEKISIQSNLNERTNIAVTLSAHVDRVKILTL